MKRFLRDKKAVIGTVLLVVILVVSFLVPAFWNLSYSATDLTAIRQAPGSGHLLGTDELGRDILARLIYGGRVSMSVAIAAVGIQLVIGTIVGALAGYFGGFLDSLLMRTTDVFMCFPFFIIAVCLAAILGPSLRNSVLIIGLLQWPGIARIVRAQVLSVRENDHITAARSLGLSSARIVFRHILPNVISPIIVSATLAVANAIIAEASLSFLGLGVPMPEPSWGNMLTAAQNMQALAHEWWRWLPPGLMIVITVLSINYLGEGIEKAFSLQAGEHA